MPGVFLQVLKNLHHMPGQWHDMHDAHFHFLGRDTPFRRFKIELRPFRPPQFARAHKDIRGQPQGSPHNQIAGIDFNGPQQCAYGFWFFYTGEVGGLDRGPSAPLMPAAVSRSARSVAMA